MQLIARIAVVLAAVIDIIGIIAAILFSQAVLPTAAPSVRMDLFSFVILSLLRLAVICNFLFFVNWNNWKTSFVVAVVSWCVMLATQSAIAILAALLGFWAVRDSWKVAKKEKEAKQGSSAPKKKS